MQGTFDSSAVVESERPYTMSHIIDVFACDIQLAEVDGAIRESCFRRPAEIRYNFDEILQFRLAVQRITDMGRHDAQEQFEVVRDFPTGQFASPG